jgi:hypothetical protein
MRYLVDLSISEVQKIKLLIDSGKYEDVQNFILTAVENQLYLEKQPIEHLPPEPHMSQHFKEDSSSSQNLLSTGPLEIEMSDIVLAQEPNPEMLSSDILWALYNRILPMKITLRVLLSILKAKPSGDGYVDLATVADAAVEAAKKLNFALSRIDKKSHRMPGEKLSAGLPGAGDRSSERFKFYFVGTINSRGRIEGGPATLRFVNIKRDNVGQPKIGITESGFRFAVMENPVLDKSEYSCPFSDEEGAFYFQHISEKLPMEYKLAVNILKAIKEGNAKPNELTRVVLEAKSELSNKEAEAIRSSAVSRLSEFGLLARTRKGLNVTYSLCEKASALLVNQN